MSVSPTYDISAAGSLANGDALRAGMPGRLSAPTTRRPRRRAARIRHLLRKKPTVKPPGGASSTLC